MFHKLAESLTEHFLKHDLIEERQIPFCCYKLEQLIGSVVFFLILLLISIATKSYLEAFSFAVSASVFRRHMGGWHAPSAWLCQIMSTLLVLFIILLIGPMIEAIDKPAVIFALSVALTLVSLCIHPAFPPQMHMTETETHANQKLKNLCLLILLLVQLISYLFLDFRIVIYTALGLAVTLFTVSLEQIIRYKEGCPT